MIKAKGEGTQITHLIAVREAVRLFWQLANNIIDDSPQPAGPVVSAQTHIQLRFGHEERGYTLDHLSDRVLRPTMEVMVAVISRDHKRIYPCSSMYLKVPDGWSGATCLYKGTSMRLATINEGDPDREVTRLDVLYGIVGK
jgi:hypothetical protein